MKQISTYFNAEKSESVLFIAAGIAAIILSVYFFIKLKQPFYNGIAFSLIAIALIQLTVGTTVYLRSPKDIIRVNNIMETNKTKIATEEIPRMKAVMKSFALYKWIEIALILVGICLFFYFKQPSLWKGIGLGLFIQAAIMLLLDFFAESRGKVYVDYLQSVA
jgi:hypothetical protein